LRSFAVLRRHFTLREGSCTYGGSGCLRMTQGMTPDDRTMTPTLRPSILEGREEKNNILNTARRETN